MNCACILLFSLIDFRKIFVGWVYSIDFRLISNRCSFVKWVRTIIGRPGSLNQNAWRIEFRQIFDRLSISPSTLLVVSLYHFLFPQLLATIAYLMLVSSSCLCSKYFSMDFRNATTGMKSARRTCGTAYLETASASPIIILKRQ